MATSFFQCPSWDRGALFAAQIKLATKPKFQLIGGPAIRNVISKEQKRNSRLEAQTHEPQEMLGRIPQMASSRGA